MEFGKVDPALLDDLDLSLPPDPRATTLLLQKSKVRKPKVYVGCAKWGRPEWVGKIYPKGTRASQFLDEYARQFNCIEFNAIYYKLPDKKQVETWLGKVTPGFLFCPKFTDSITHIKRLKNAGPEVGAFLRCLDDFGAHLGPVFLMPHPQMGPKHFDTIREFISGLPADLDLYLELRHPDWFRPENSETMFEFLQQNKRGMVITDAAGRRDCVHMRLTTPNAFIRFVGNSLHKSDYQRIDEWVQRIRLWLEQGLQNCYFFMHQHEELYSPELCKYLIQELNKHCGLDIPEPRFVASNELF